jgi:CRISPR/Cas system CSM-associated protein Csm3 (group 7 of RAMP superfamily)
MKDFFYKLDFHSFWHCGSGLSSGSDLDSLVIKDENGFPFVPGKTIKGLLKEAAEFIRAFSSHEEQTDWDEFIISVFGMQTDKDFDDKQSEQGNSYFSNALLSKELQLSLSSLANLTTVLYRKISSTKIDDNGVAKEHSLRKNEVTVPLTLYGKISGIGPENKEKMTRCLSYVKRLGVNRNRGLGRCTFAVWGD